MTTKYYFHSLFLQTSFKIQMMQVLQLLVLHVKNITTTSLHEFMEIDNKMALAVVKEQFNHLKVKKITKEEGKNPLTW
jgi:hypothetical protein